MLDDKFVPQFNITLRCNMYEVCKYCYVKEQQLSLPLDMDTHRFDILLGWFMELGVDEVILLGGEPTLHPDFGDVLTVLNDKKISARLFSNGTYGINIGKIISDSENVDTIFFHYDEDYLNCSTGIRERFFRNLENAFEAKKKLWLRWNISSLKASTAKVVHMAEKYNASIGYSISVPSPRCNSVPIAQVNEYTESLLRLFKSAREREIHVAPARAFPLCAFEPEKLELLKKMGGVTGNCKAINDLTVNTDLSLQLCSVTHPISTAPPNDVDELKEKIEILKEEELKLRSEPAMPECKDCDYFTTGECQGGCYGYKLYGKIQDLEAISL